MGKAIKIYFILITASLILGYFLYLLTPLTSASKREETLKIDQGQSVEEIAQSLKEAGFIRSQLAFKVYGFVSGALRRLKPGDYNLKPSLSTPDIIALLLAGPKNDIQVTIIEGENLAEIDKKFSELGIISAKGIQNYKFASLRVNYPFLEKAKFLEGFLFPDTYRFFNNSSPEEVIRKILDNFQKKAWPLLKNSRVEDDSLTEYEIVILASLIEKEVPLHNDRLIVSGILRKRLGINMALQVDAAPETYKRYGLPTTPIANPGLNALYAATHPKTSEYWYYLSDPKTQKTIFSRTFEEHDENRSRYLKK